MTRAILIAVLSVLINSGLSATEARWMWYPGDYELWLGNQMNNRRTERGAFFPPFWKMDCHYVLVEFSRQVTLTQSEEITIAAEGRFNLKLNGKLQFGMPRTFTLPAGTHQLNIKVWNQSSPPALYINGATVKSGPGWKVTFEDKEWIDESGKASDTSATTYRRAGSGSLTDIANPPSRYRLETEVWKPVKSEKIAQDKKAGKTESLSSGENQQTRTTENAHLLLDFGKETFGYLQLHGLTGSGKVKLFYGESREEALDTAYCETLDRLTVSKSGVTDEALQQSTAAENQTYTLTNSKAFRYVYVISDPSVNFSDIDMLYEYKPLTQRGSFRSSDEELNRIWEVGEYTMRLTTREFFIDGIKRDRWTWSGDAIQSYLMNYYLCFDTETVRNTIWLLRGKDPVTSHTNTIMDYTFYWFISIYDYYLYTGDAGFIREVYPLMQSMMEYVLGRTNVNGMVEGMTGDWVFVDWADGYLDKKGELAYEQVLFARSLETMAKCAELSNDRESSRIYRQKARKLIGALEPAFWNSDQQALVHNRIDGQQQPAVTRYANMFAIFYNYLPEAKKNQVKTSVLLNDSILKITTPYMRFYELEALCALGEHRRVMQEMKAYWGGMLREGATTFWEKYNPDDKGAQHLAMYGRPYGKSLCHAWGASPIYLLGKYYLGIQPLKPGYSEYLVKPNLGGLKWMEGSVPTPDGNIKLKMDERTIHVSGGSGTGWLEVESRTQPKVSNGSIEKTGEKQYRIRIEKNTNVTVSYRAI